MPGALQNWFWSDVSVGIAGQLLAAEPDAPHRVDEIANEMGRNDRVVRGLLDRLHDGRLVTRTKFVTGEAGRPAWGYWVNKEQRVIAQRAVNTPRALWPAREPGDTTAAPEPTGSTHATATEGEGIAAASSDAAPNPAGGDVSPAGLEFHASPRELGTLHRGQELVIVGVGGTAYADLLEAMSSASIGSVGSWLARTGDELVFAFEGKDPVTRASEFLSVIAGARLSVRQVGVAQVIPTENLTDQARRISPAIRRARMMRDAHDVPSVARRRLP